MASAVSISTCCHPICHTIISWKGKETHQHGERRHDLLPRTHERSERMGDRCQRLRETDHTRAPHARSVALFAGRSLPPLFLKLASPWPFWITSRASHSSCSLHPILQKSISSGHEPLLIMTLAVQVSLSGSCCCLRPLGNCRATIWTPPNASSCS